ncbi:FAD-dependent monooxygenase [Arthrobacter sp. H14]|uniref:FAD-dependent monooxygenase n=1 Tax=Arthrobacter sp. H14 TaxID=1312959 RepID=UPI0004BA59BF|nr:FAD-dependent monooxygenase [Arthrobacter sp. H14]
MSGQIESTDVLVVGAGPTGLMLANWLVKLGIDCALIDSKSGPTRESRALGVQARTMEIYDQLGIASEVVRASQVAEGIAPGYEHKPFGYVRFLTLGAGSTPYPHIYIFEQSRNEELLSGNLQRLGSGVRWEQRITALQDEVMDDGGTGVSATVEGPGGQTGIRARYCVGTDGTSSAVRKLRQIPFEGRTNQHTFYVADAHGVTGLMPASINLRFGAEYMLLGFPMGTGGHDRLLGIVRQQSGREDDEPVESSVRPMLRRVFGVSYESSSWFSTYRVHHRVAAGFRDGPVFLAGDAAHVHSPVGAQGMNTGLQDAHNLAFKLAAVLKGEAPDSYLDRYSAERRPVALRLTRTTDRLFGAVTSDNFFLRQARRFLLPLAAPVGIRVIPRLAGGSRLFEYISQVRIHYWMSERAREDARGRRGRVVGRRLPWTGQNFEALKATRWQAHVYGDINAVRLEALRSELDVEVLTFPANPRKGLAGGKVFLIRPDGFVVAEAFADQAAAAFQEAIREHVGTAD